MGKNHSNLDSIDKKKVLFRTNKTKEQTTNTSSYLPEFVSRALFLEVGGDGPEDGSVTISKHVVVDPPIPIVGAVIVIIASAVLLVVAFYGLKPWFQDRRFLAML